VAIPATGCNTWCGDGVLQPERGEECDDGAFLAGDGCSHGCAFEACAQHALVVRAGQHGDDLQLLVRDEGGAVVAAVTPGQLGAFQTGEVRTIPLGLLPGAYTVELRALLYGPLASG